MNKIPFHKFTAKNSAQTNHIYLLENKSESPFIGPVSGWKIVGYGEAPWPGSSDGFAVMLEKTSPEEEYGGLNGEDWPEGSLIWHHMKDYIYHRMVNNMDEQSGTSTTSGNTCS